MHFIRPGSFKTIHLWQKDYFRNKINISIETNREIIAQLASAREDENDLFREFINNRHADSTDTIVHRLNSAISSQIDCTACGACCRNLMINVTPEEAASVGAHLEISDAEFREKYIEESAGGQLIMNTIPCHFLSGSFCTIYAERFAECREFPHLHKPNFRGRLFGTLMHYSICPIIFNVIEALKIETGFKIDH